MVPSTVGRLVDRFRSSPPLPASSRAPVDPAALWWKSGRAESPSASLSDHSRATDSAVETALFAVASAAPDSGDVISRALAVIQESRRAYETGLLRGLQPCAPMQGAPFASSSGVKPISTPFTPSALNVSASAPAESDAFDALDALNDVRPDDSVAHPTPPASAVTQPAARAPSAERLSVLSFGSSPDMSSTHVTSSRRRTSALPLGFAARIPSLRPQPELAAAEAAAAAETFCARVRAPTPPLEREARGKRTDSLTIAINAGIDSAMQTLGVPCSSADSIDSAIQALRLPAGYNEDGGGTAAARAFEDHSLYADPAVIALEDPELTIARLRRRLATVDDAFAPRLAPYTPAFAAGAAAHAAAEHAAMAAAAEASLRAEQRQCTSASSLLVYTRGVGENTTLPGPPQQPLFLSPDSTFFGTESFTGSTNAEMSGSELGAAAARTETSSLSSSASASGDESSNDDTSDDSDDGTSDESDADTLASTAVNQTAASISSTAAAATVKTADLLSRLRDAMYCSETALLI